eukprot:jgi/Botrbrau1/5922/Bobra.0366s0096.1
MGDSFQVTKERRATTAPRGPAQVPFGDLIRAQEEKKKAKEREQQERRLIREQERRAKAASQAPHLLRKRYPTKERLHTFIRGQLANAPPVTFEGLRLKGVKPKKPTRVKRSLLQAQALQLLKAAAASQPALSKLLEGSESFQHLEELGLRDLSFSPSEGMSAAMPFLGALCKTLQNTAVDDLQRLLLHIEKCKKRRVRVPDDVINWIHGVITSLGMVVAAPTLDITSAPQGVGQMPEAGSPEIRQESGGQTPGVQGQGEIEVTKEDRQKAALDIARAAENESGDSADEDNELVGEESSSEDDEDLSLLLGWEDKIADWVMSSTQAMRTVQPTQELSHHVQNEERQDKGNSAQIGFDPEESDDISEEIDDEALFNIVLTQIMESEAGQQAPADVPTDEVTINTGTMKREHSISAIRPAQLQHRPGHDVSVPAGGSVVYKDRNTKVRGSASSTAVSSSSSRSSLSATSSGFRAVSVLREDAIVEVASSETFAETMEAIPSSSSGELHQAEAHGLFPLGLDLNVERVERVAQESVSLQIHEFNILTNDMTKGKRAISSGSEQAQPHRASGAPYGWDVLQTPSLLGRSGQRQELPSSPETQHLQGARSGAVTPLKEESWKGPHSLNQLGSPSGSSHGQRSPSDSQSFMHGSPIHVTEAFSAPPATRPGMATGLTFGGSLGLPPLSAADAAAFIEQQEANRELGVPLPSAFHSGRLTPSQSISPALLTSLQASPAWPDLDLHQFGLAMSDTPSSLGFDTFQDLLSGNSLLLDHVSVSMPPSGLAAYSVPPAQPLLRDLDLRTANFQEVFSHLARGVSQARHQIYESSAPSQLLSPHEYRCVVCNIVCCGPSNYEQHNRSKKHLRKVAQLKSLFGEYGEGEESGPSSTAIESLDGQGDSIANTTYVGFNSSCRPYCTQVITTELNNIVTELVKVILGKQDEGRNSGKQDEGRNFGKQGEQVSSGKQGQQGSPGKQVEQQTTDNAPEKAAPAGGVPGSWFQD